MKNQKLIILIASLFFCINLGLNINRNQKLTFNLSVITFIEYTSVLNEEGMSEVDSLGKLMRCNEELFEKVHFVFNPYNSKKEYDSNSFIGFERFRVVKEILERKYRIKVESNIWYNDKTYEVGELYRNETGLYINAYPY